jgi:hypothetical protein
MKISYAITVKDELAEIQRLVPFLLKKKRPQDEIVILYDQDNGDEAVTEFLKPFNIKPNVQFWRGFDFNGHFANWKNKLTDYCEGDYIFQIDADEMPNESLIDTLPFILEQSGGVDVILVPRVNTVEGLTEAHIKKWGWRVDEKGWVNFPDCQWRIYRKDSSIRWVNKVHERLEGFKTYACLPLEEEYSLYHPKDIARQERQNSYYETL